MSGRIAPTLLWFWLDLRLEDNAALRAAAGRSCFALPAMPRSMPSNASA